MDLALNLDPNVAIAMLVCIAFAFVALIAVSVRMSERP